MARARIAASTRIHAVVGSDDAEVKRVGKDLAAQLAPPGEFSCDVIDGCVDYAQDAVQRIHETIDALMTFPFFGGAKLVWLKNATFLADNVTGRAANVLDALQKLADALGTDFPEGTQFLLTGLEVDKRRSFYKNLQKIGRVQVFDKVDTSRSGWEENAIDLARTMAAQRGLAFDDDALELFALSTGGDRRGMESELEKIDLYLGAQQREVTAHEVRLLVPFSRTGVVFELANAIAARDLRGALNLLEQLLFQGESAIGILLVAIIPTVRSLLLVKDLMTRHRLSRPSQAFLFGKALERLPAEATAHLPRKKDGTVNTYALGIAACHAHRHDTEQLRRAFDTCVDANVRLVTSSLDPKIVLTQLIVRIVSG